MESTPTTVADPQVFAEGVQRKRRGDAVGQQVGQQLERREVANGLEVANVLARWPASPSRDRRREPRGREAPRPPEVAASENTYGRPAGRPYMWIIDPWPLIPDP